MLYEVITRLCCRRAESVHPAIQLREQSDRFNQPDQPECYLQNQVLRVHVVITSYSIHYTKLYEPCTNVAPSGTLSANPPLRSSRAMTSRPSRRRCSATCDPMNPAAPVTSALIQPVSRINRSRSKGTFPTRGYLFEARPGKPHRTEPRTGR